MKSKTQDLVLPEPQTLIEARLKLRAHEKRIADQRKSDAELGKTLSKLQAKREELKAQWAAEDAAAAAALDRGDFTPAATSDAVRASHLDMLDRKINSAINHLFGDRGAYKLWLTEKAGGYERPAPDSATLEKLEAELPRARWDVTVGERDHRDACRLLQVQEHVAALRLACAPIEGESLAHENFTIAKSGSRVTISFNTNKS